MSASLRRLHKRRTRFTGNRYRVIRISVDTSGFTNGIRKAQLDLERTYHPARAKQRLADVMTGNKRRWANQ